mgnify:CR=1 FL=1
MVEVFQRCRSREIPDAFLTVLAEGWTSVFEQLQRAGRGIVCELEEIEVSLLDDDEMARVHGEFLDDPTPTDVITFDHGELLIGVETAGRQALEYRGSLEAEIALYGIHGLLHLSGFDDREKSEAQVMEERQDEIFREVFEPVLRDRQFF